MATEKPYPEVDPRADYPALERGVLARWERDETFRRSVEARPTGESEYVFYDGPPFANGLPHFGHLLTGYVKDLVPRYQTLRGRRVERRFGWDCHGLPAEMEAEKQLGISGRGPIVEYGIERFNEHCRTSVMRYTAEWERYVTRAARWVDFRNDYKTMDLSYMESVLWAFKQLHEKGLVYESYRVMPYSWAAETPVSNFETRLDDSYRERQDPAVTVRLELEPADGDAAPTDLLIWTTTPWTLPSNLAAAVGPDIEYAVFERDGRRWILGAATAAKYERELEGARPIGTVRGAELVGRRYRPLFPYFEGHANAFQVLAADFVDTEEGTGVVHMAPGFGEDDQALCAAHDIAVVCPVDERGRFTDEVHDWAGENVLEANPAIIRALKERGVLVRHDTIVHSYPHCWRTDQPLIYRALSSWYVNVTAFRERMVELNKGIAWVPEHIRDGQFGKWLEGARDWSISRNRFWGTPLPIWRSDDPAYPRVDVYGSLDELERDFGVRPTDLHRPGIDALTRPNPDDPTGRSTMRRVEDVFDCWFESGSMPYASVHYPFENREWFDGHFPADFIVEYVSQTRGWFYTLMVLSTALFDRPPFENCICHGVIVASDGRKLSKRLRNYPEPETVFETYGADALRWYLMASPLLRGGDLAVSADGREIGDVVRLVLNPIWSAWSFFTLYANADGLRGSWRTDSTAVLDRYALAKTRALVERTQAAMDAYDIPASCEEIRGYLDALNNWIIRRSRSRFWRASEPGDDDKQAAYDTLYTCLATLCRVASPHLPYLTEAIYTGLTGEESVHLSDWPGVDELPDEPELVAAMDRARAVCSAVLGLREEAKKRVRLPLPRLVIAGHDAEALAPFVELISEEVNVKAVELSSELESFGRFELVLDARVLGPRVGKDMKTLLAAAKAGEWSQGDDGPVVAGRALAPDEFRLAVKPREGLDGLAIDGLPTNDMVVALDVVTTPALEREGLVRDLVRQIQATRRDGGLHVSDRIRLWVVEAPDEVRAGVEEQRAFIAEQALADEITVGSAPASVVLTSSSDALNVPVRVALEKV